MKRSTEVATESFFSLNECIDILLPRITSPLFVAQFIVLNKELRRNVWRVLSRPDLCSSEWIHEFLREMFQIVSQPMKSKWKIASDTSPGAFNWPVFMFPCKHTSKNSLLLGRVGCNLDMHSLESMESEEDEDEECCYYCQGLVASITRYYTHWQPICCDKVDYFKWRLVARALADNVDKRIVLMHQDNYNNSFKREYSYFLIQ